MLGSLSSLAELVKLFIILLSEDSTQNILGLTRTYTSFPFWYVLKFSKFADK